MLSSIPLIFTVAAGFAVFDYSKLLVAGAQVQGTASGKNDLPKVNATSFGKCSDFKIEYGGGFGKRPATEMTFRPADSKTFTHQEAFNFGIISQFMCYSLLNTCGFKQGGKEFDDCVAIKNHVGSGKNPNLADKWNSAFGLKTNSTSANSTGNSSTMPPEKSVPEPVGNMNGSMPDSGSMDPAKQQSDKTPGNNLTSSNPNPVLPAKLSLKQEDDSSVKSVKKEDDSSSKSSLKQEDNSPAKGDGKNSGCDKDKTSPPQLPRA